MRVCVQLKMKIHWPQLIAYESALSVSDISISQMTPHHQKAVLRYGSFRTAWPVVKGVFQAITCVGHSKVVKDCTEIITFIEIYRHFQKLLTIGIGRIVLNGLFCLRHAQAPSRGDKIQLIKLLILFIAKNC